MSHLGARTPPKCTICGTKWGERSPWSGMIEEPVLLPCGALFGAQCLRIQLTSQPHHHRHQSQKDPDAEDPRARCPDCSQPLWYASCGHPVRPHRVSVQNHHGVVSREGGDGGETPLPLVTSAAEMPLICEECSLVALPIRRRLEIMQANHEHFLDCYVDRQLEPHQVTIVAGEHAEYEAELGFLGCAAEMERKKFVEARRGW